MNPAADVWSKVLELMQPEMTSTTIKTWFDDATAVALEETRFVLYSPSRWKRDIIASRYVPRIQAALKELFSSDLEVVVLTEDQLASYTKPKPESFAVTDKYTFDNFVVGPSNKYAYNAALAVAEGNGENYNPLFIYGQPGLGKTHLLYAIAHKVRQLHPEHNIQYLKSEDFVNELIGYLRRGADMQQFRDKYRTADLFLMDDVQFIAGKDSSEEELFHTFNTLYEQGKPIVFTSDRPPTEMLRLEQRLRDRFRRGLTCDVQPPDYETRVAIIKNKSIRMGVELPAPVLEYIAENITSSVRQIEGTVNKLLAYQDLMGDAVNKDTVLRAVKDMLNDKTDILPTAGVIIEEVCKFFNLEPDVLRGQTRTKDVVYARQIAMYQIRQMTNLSLKEIGREFDGRDHTTVMHSAERIETMLKTDRELKEIIKDITSNVNNRYD